MRVRVPQYLGHSKWNAKLIHFLSLPYRSLIRKKVPIYCWVDRENFLVSPRMVKPSLKTPTFRLSALNPSRFNHSTPAPLNKFIYEHIYKYIHQFIMISCFDLTDGRTDGRRYEGTENWIPISHHLKRFRRWFSVCARWIWLLCSTTTKCVFQPCLFWLLKTMGRLFKTNDVVS